MQFWALVVDSFRESLDRKIFWVMVAITLLITSAMLCVGIETDRISIFFGLWPIETSFLDPFSGDGRSHIVGAVVYLLGTGYILPYKIIFVIMNFLGAIFSLEVVWNFGDSALGLMSLPNLIALIFLSRKVKGMTDEYFAKDHKPLR